MGRHEITVAEVGFSVEGIGGTREKQLALPATMPQHVTQRAARPEYDGAVDLARDRMLVRRCQDGDETAFAELYSRYHRRLFHFCYRRLHQTQEAEDASQEAFARAWRAMPRFAGERRFYPWLTVIAGNICTDMQRRQSRQYPVAEVPMPTVDLSSVDVDERLVHEVDVDTVHRAARATLRASPACPRTP